MTFEECVTKGLSEDYPIKVILKGYVTDKSTQKLGVVEVVYITQDSVLAREKFEDLLKNNVDDAYYMVYAVPFDTDLTTLNHYPSIAISGEDLE